MNKYIEAVGQFKIKTERLYKFPSVSINHTGIKYDPGYIGFIVSVI